MKTRVLLGFTFEAKTQEEKNGNKMSKKKQHHQVSEDGGVWTIKTSTTLKTMELKFKVFYSINSFASILHPTQSCRGMWDMPN